MVNTIRHTAETVEVPRRNRRGLIEARLATELPGWCAGFPGEIAGASLKPR